ncbi:amidase domain-containing protein [Clostridium amazonitimonense]|uniref:amidase domain-containing protein n=1 Tax=Clostridium amazonitimonense TaxID=1499689 RepID=UPI00050967A0|nr:amidase domain-containing protein [Clostridium amazonitimonense]
MKRKTCILTLFLTLLFTTVTIRCSNAAQTNKVSEETKKELEELISSIYNARSTSFISGDLSILPSYFDTSNKFGRWALEHEVKRVKYLRDWAAQRNMAFTEVTSEPNLKRITPTNKGFKIAIDEYYKFKYVYKDDEDPIENVFGVGIAHSLELIKKEDKWLVYSDWYTDCFEDALKAYSGEIKEDVHSTEGTKFQLPNCPKTKIIPSQVPKGQYDRFKAVEYADKYCGIPWASGYEKKYNKKYKNFTGIGGNCTNYVSQCLGDKEEGGGLKFDGAWYCVYNKYDGASGSTAWVNADGFKNYLLHSGRGRLIKKGTFNALAIPSNDNPCAAVSKLEIGDVICYAKGSDIDHFAIVTGFDSHGYPLINSHTTDRYHVPWDLGWGDKNISFYLIHLR